jgi:hypothetical protein
MAGHILKSLFMSNIQHLSIRCLLTALIILPCLVNAQVKEEWVARNINGNDIAVDEKGNVYVTGFSVGTGTASDYATVKYNANGVQQWVAGYNGPGNGFDQAISLAVDKDGNVYVTGESNGSGTGLDFATIKYNVNGLQQWVARYNGPGNGDDGLNFTGPAFPQRLAVDNSGNVYVTGPSLGNGTGVDYATIKYNNAGMQEWVARYNGPLNGFDAAASLAMDKNGNVYVTGVSEGIGTGNDFATISYNANGVQQWVTRYNGPVNNNDAARDITLDTDGNVYVTGSSVRGFIQFEGEEFPITNYLTIRYNTAGVQQWEATYDGPGGRYIVSRPFALAVDTLGNVYVTGQSGASTDEEDYATVKYDATGVQQWAARYTSTGFDHRAFDISLDGSGNVYVTGQSDENYVTVKYNTNGVQQWVAKGNDLGFGAVALSITVDVLGNVYVTGRPATIKYSQPMPICGNKGNKILVCHKGKQTLCINKADVSNHLNHGDQPGQCVVKDARVTANESQFSEQRNEIPNDFRMFNAPNPVSAITKIYYELPVEAHVSIKVYDVLGREIITLVNADRKKGYHSTEFNVSALRDGLYYCRVTVKTINKVWVQTVKIRVVK